MTVDKQIRVAVVGAGLSGLVAVKECLSGGLDVTAFDARDSLGGAWAYQPCTPTDASRPGADDHILSSMYDGTILNSCRDTSSFSDFPLDPARYPDFFRHDLMFRYLNKYAAHFDLARHVRLRTKVLDCEPQDDGRWMVRVQEVGQEGEGERRVEESIFDAVFAAPGHLSKPYTPDFEGRDSFQGRFLHSHFYRTPGPFEGQRVAIIGFGSSAVDISCEVAPSAKQVHLVTRRGGWVLPRYCLGLPTEAWDNRATQAWMPLALSQWLQTQLLKLIDVKLPEPLKPDHKILEQSPTVRGDFAEKVCTGLITPHRACVSAFTPNGITLSTGEHLDVDVVICATGYDGAYLPFLPAHVVRAPDTAAHHVDLYKLMMPPAHHNLFLLGFVEVIGPLPPVVEAQARYAVALLQDRLPRLSEAAMRADVARAQAFADRHFVRSPRHALLVHHVAYTDELLSPLGARPAFSTLLGRVFKSNPLRALAVLNAVWFGIPASAQWRLCGGDKEEGKLAVETMLRIAGGKKQLSAFERSALGMAM